MLKYCSGKASACPVRQVATVRAVRCAYKTVTAEVPLVIMTGSEIHRSVGVYGHNCGRGTREYRVLTK